MEMSLRGSLERMAVNPPSLLGGSRPGDRVGEILAIAADVVLPWLSPSHTHLHRGVLAFWHLAPHFLVISSLSSPIRDLHQL